MEQKLRPYIKSRHRLAWLLVIKHICSNRTHWQAASAAGLISLLAAPSFAQSATGSNEEGHWRFQTTADTANKSLVQQLIELKKADSFTSNNTYDIDYNIDGNYINCSVSSTATGNSGAIDQYAPIGSPDIDSTPTFTASTNGNTNDSLMDAASGASTLREQDPFARDLEERALGLIQSDQTLTESDLSSTVAGTSSGFNLGSASGDGGNGSAALNSNQSNTNSTLIAEVRDANACAFNDHTGTGAANASE
jgi:hypothetical protein